MDALDGLRDIISKANRRGVRYPAIADLPEEARGVNFNPSVQGSASIGKAHEVDIKELLPNPYNRKLDNNKIKQIKRDIKESKEIYPLVYSEIDREGKKAKMVTDGHHRYQALKELGYKKVPIVISDERGMDTKAPKEVVEKTRVRRRFGIGENVLVFLPREGAFEQAVIVSQRGLDRYQVRSSFTGRNHLVDGGSLRSS